MTWAVYDPVKMDVLRLDNSKFPPQGEPFVQLPEQMTQWPDIPAGARWRVVGSRLAIVDERTIQQRREQAWAAIKADRLKEVAGDLESADASQAAGLNGAAIVARSRALRSRINAATTAQELAAITWKQGV